ncbi:MAG: alpha-L-arabinofuranosidase [Candidatus Hydrogenedentes bacterium]|nr:alpha-L-arabinofuranosidase [Candidatus Hydrogenedentota bacterium]
MRVPVASVPARFLFVAVLTLCIVFPVKGRVMADSIKNASFEEEGGDGPAGWTTQTWGGKADFTFEEGGRGGGHCVAVASEDGADAAWCVTAGIEPWSQYRLTGWVKTQNVTTQNGRGALLNLHNMQPLQTGAVTGTHDWTRVELVFDSEENEEVQINCLLGGWGTASGKAWFDDLDLALLKTESSQPVARIETSKTGALISKYLYGQFIEHLGRCIYGGIWAEMLEDRKFFYGIGEEESPWRKLGDVNAVTMTQEAPYVGEHMPRIEAKTAPAGIAHGGLGLVSGKVYTGRIVLAGSGSLASVEVSLAWGAAPAQRQTITLGNFAGAFRTYPLSFTAGADTDDGALEVLVRGPGRADIGAVSLMPADHVHGMRADTLAVLKELNAPIYRWPGGNFVSGYNWNDGIGDPDKRPPRKNPAWQGIEHNDFGINEFLTFCREVNAEPYIVVNSGLGDLSLALGELEYVNGPADSPMSRLRAEHGHPEPYGVVWWGIGNEMYGDWQLGHMPLEEYVNKHNAFAEAMRAADASVKLVAVGATGKWSDTMLAECADHMDLLSEHFYCGGSPRVSTHVRQIRQSIRAKVSAHREAHKTIPALAGKQVPICMDEWNYWYGDHVYGELGTPYFLKDAVGVAMGLHEYFRSSDIVYMANYAQTVNVIGCVKTSKTAAAFDTTGLVLQLYRNHYGAIPVEVSDAPAYLDIAAAWTEDRGSLTVAVVNPAIEARELELEVSGCNTGAGRRWVLTGPGPMAHNEPGKPPLVTVQEEQISGGTQTLQLPPLSVCLYEFPAQ